LPIFQSKHLISASQALQALVLLLNCPIVGDHGVLFEDTRFDNELDFVDLAKSIG
jgi:hypothetical protein